MQPARQVSLVGAMIGLGFSRFMRTFMRPGCAGLASWEMFGDVDVLVFVFPMGVCRE